MQAYLVRRLLLAFGTLAGLSFVIFLFLRFIPGDATTLLLGADVSSSPAQLHELRHRLGLDQSAPVQYFTWLGHVLRGELGRSLFSNRSVTAEIGARLPTTAELALIALLVAALFGIPAGTLSALRHNRTTDQVLRAVSIIGLAVPNFWLGTMVLVFGARWFNWVPPISYTSPFTDPLRNLEEFIIPGLVVGLAFAATLTRLTRSAVLEVMREDYVRTARAKGLMPRTVVVRHVIRNSLIPVVTLLGIQLGLIVAGTVIVENVFNLPGMGRLILDGITRKDFPLVQGIILLYGTFVVLINLLVDWTYGIIDPRIHYV